MPKLSTITFQRKVLYFRWAVALAIFLLTWLLLALASSLVNQEAINSLLDDKLGLKFLSPTVQGYIKIHGWQLLAALLVAGYSYLKGKDRCTRWLASRVAKAQPLVAEWVPLQAPLNLPAEFIVSLDGSHLSPPILLRNEGNETLKITRVEAIGMASREVQLHNGDGMGERIEQLSISPTRSDGELVWWKELAPFHWVIEDPILLQERAECTLPTLGIEFDNNNQDTTERLQLLVGDTTLRVSIRLFIYYEEKKITHHLAAPIRIFSPYDEDEAEQADVKTLVGKLAPDDRTEQDRLYKLYEGWLQIFQQIRADYETANDQKTEKNLLVEWRHELEPYDRWIELQPADPMMHFQRGNFLFEKGLLYEPLSSFQKALGLGLHTHELYVLIAWILVGLNRYEEALDSLKAIAEPDLKDYRYFLIRGQVFYHQKKYPAAKADLEEAIRLNPKEYTAYISLGLTIRSIEPFAAADLVKLLQAAVDEGYTNRVVIEDFSKMVGDPEHSEILEMAGRMKGE